MDYHHKSARPCQSTWVDFSKNECSHRILRGQHVLITGAAVSTWAFLPLSQYDALTVQNGLGEACASRLGMIGACVTVADRELQRAEELANNLRSIGARVLAVSCDVTIYESQLAAFQRAIEHFGRLDHVIANAGLRGQVLPRLPMALPDLRHGPPAPPIGQFHVNVIGAYYTLFLASHFLTADFLPNCAEVEGSTRHTNRTAWKSIVMMGSVAGYKELENMPDYSGSKWAIRGMMRAAKRPLGAQGIRINLVAPTFVDTALVGGAIENFRRKGWAIAEATQITDVILRVLCDSDISGRSVYAGPDGGIDLGDDPDGHDGATTTAALVEKGFIPSTRSRL